MERTQYEFDGESELLNEEQEWEANDQELELAAELLTVNGEQQLDQFLGKLFRKVGGVAKGLLTSPAGQQLKGMLRGAIKQALPKAGRALGTYFGGSAGGDAGVGLATQAGQLLGLELEGLSAEDQELEVARRLVRFSSGAVRQLGRTPRGSDPRKAAMGAMTRSARRYAPGMLSRNRNRRRGRPQTSTRFSPSSSGRWVRRNGRIVLLDL